MAKENSFDIVSQVDLQEVNNAVNQAVKELKNRFDFKGSKSEINYDGKQITLIGDDEFKLKNVVDILEARLVKRGINLKALRYGKIEPAKIPYSMELILARVWRGYCRSLPNLSRIAN